MRAVIQRVKTAEVTVEGKTIGKIGKGYMVLLGIEDVDATADMEYICDKILGLRVFEDEEDKMNLDICDVSGSVLLISQFTLYGDARKGRRPSFIKAARPETAVPLYEAAIARLSEKLTVATGEFGAHMDVSLVNDGPVTILLDSRKTF